MRNDENGWQDYEQEEREIRQERAYQRALIKRDPFYPPELHQQDVRGKFGLEEE